MSLVASHKPDKIVGKEPATNVSGERAILMVTGGELSGARMNLDVGRTYSIGSDEVCDIVLRGAVHDGSTMQITLYADNVRIAHSNSVASSANAAYRDELSFGSAQFFIVQSDELSNLSLATSTNPVHAELFDDMDDAEPANADAAGIAAVSPDSQVDQPLPNEQAPEQEGAQGARGFRRPMLYAGIICIVGIAALSVVLWQSASFVKPVAEVVPVESYLADAGFSHLKVDRSASTAVISGFVESRQQALNLAQIVAKQNESVLNRVQVEAEIRDQIENVLRVNGVTGLVESLGNGAFVANTKLPLGGKLDDLQAMIERDVPSVASFTVQNQLPEQPFVAPENESVQLDAGKRVVLVNSDNPAYVVTEDQSRYFIGSILPGGYRITSITDGRVLLEKKGKTTELKF